MSDPVRIERVKLGASALNTLATACVTIGVIAPLAAFLYGLSTPAATGWQLAASAAMWTFIGAGLHLAAQIVLRRLRS